MQKLKAVTILLIIIVSLIPAYLFHNYLRNIIRPRDSGARLIAYILSVFAFIFGYTFLLGFIIRMIFPGA
jgi:hypothetical protein